MKKVLTISIIPMIALASAFMILESGDYYALAFYAGDTATGFWSAALVEMFLVVFSTIYFVKRPVLNIIVKSLMACLFVVMIAGASLKIIGPLLTELSTTNNSDRLVSFLLEENTQSKASILLLSGQRTNTAIQAKYHRELVKTVTAEMQKENRNSWMIWVSILFTALLRFSVQSANLVLAHILGVLWRENFKSKKKQAKRDKKTGRFLAKKAWSFPKLKIAK